MDSHHHTMGDLFAQLGLPDDPKAIKEFIRCHRPMDNQLSLHQAPFWTDSQASFLKEQWKADGDWVMLIDTLNVSLRDVDDLEQAPDAPENEGEGNITAARRYNAGVQEHLQTRDVEAEARQARPATPQEAAELRRAEQEAAAKARA